MSFCVSFFVLECVQEHLFDISRALFIEKKHLQGYSRTSQRGGPNRPAVLRLFPSVTNYAKLYMISVHHHHHHPCFHCLARRSFLQNNLIFAKACKRRPDVIYASRIACRLKRIISHLVCLFLSPPLQFFFFFFFSQVSRLSYGNNL